MKKSITLLNKEIQNKALLDQLIQQLNKDFYRAVHEEAVPSDASYFEIVLNIETVLKKIIHTDSSKISTLLYLIDVPEQEVQTTLKENPDQLVEVLTYLILKRECLKIQFRNRI